MTTDRATPAMIDPPNRIGSPGNNTGRLVISSCSFAKVTIEPEKLTVPTRMVNAVAIRLKVGVSAPSPSETISCSSSRATSAAAPPPTPLNSATSCGIWVICTRCAPMTPITVPIAIAARISARCSRPLVVSTVIVASTAPAAPSRLPLRAVRGDERPLSARMKQTAATR